MDINGINKYNLQHRRSKTCLARASLCALQASIDSTDVLVANSNPLKLSLRPRW